MDRDTARGAVLVPPRTVGVGDSPLAGGGSRRESSTTSNPAVVDVVGENERIRSEKKESKHSRPTGDQSRRSRFCLAVSLRHAYDGGHRARRWCSGQALRRGGHAIRLSSSVRFFWTPVARRTAGATPRSRLDSSSSSAATRVALTTAAVGKSPSSSASPVGHPIRAGCDAGAALFDVRVAGRRRSHPPHPHLPALPSLSHGTPDRLRPHRQTRRRATTRRMTSGDRPRSIRRHHRRCQHRRRRRLHRHPHRQLHSPSSAPSPRTTRQS